MTVTCPTDCRAFQKDIRYPALSKSHLHYAKEKICFICSYQPLWLQVTTLFSGDMLWAPALDGPSKLQWCSGHPEHDNRDQEDFQRNDTDETVRGVRIVLGRLLNPVRVPTQSPNIIE